MCQEAACNGSIHGSLLAAGVFVDNTGDYTITTSYFEAVGPW